MCTLNTQGQSLYEVRAMQAAEQELQEGSKDEWQDNALREYLAGKAGLVAEATGMRESEVLDYADRLWRAMSPRYREHYTGLFRQK